MVQWHQKHNRLKRWIDSQSWLTAPPPLYNSSQNVRIISMSLTPHKTSIYESWRFASINLFPVCPCYILSAAVWDLSVCYAQLLKSCLTPFATPRIVSSPGSSIHGISQARTLEWDAISFSRVPSWPRDQTRISCIDRWIFFNTEPPGKSILTTKDVENYSCAYWLLTSSFHIRCVCVCSVVSDSLWFYGLYPARLLCPWDSPGKNTGVVRPPPGDLPDLRIEPMSPALAGGFFTTEASVNPLGTSMVPSNSLSPFLLMSYIVPPSSFQWDLCVYHQVTLSLKLLQFLYPVNVIHNEI